MSTHDPLGDGMKPIYKTAGNTPRERWKQRVMGVAYLALYTFMIVGMVWWFITAGLDRSFPLPARWALIAGTGLLVYGYVRELVVIMGVFRNDWILHKAKECSR